MIRFHLDEQQRAVRDAVRGTLVTTWPLERLRDFADGEDDYDDECWAALMALGIAGTLAPDSGIGLVEAALISEAAGEACAPGALIAQMVTVRAIATSGNSAAQSLLPRLLDGSCRAALAFDGSSAVACARSAHLILTGSRDGPLVLAEAEGLPFEVMPSTDRSRPVCRLELEAAPTHELFAADDPNVALLFDSAAVLVAADALGGAQRVLEWSVAYANEREQFGQPIGRFQGLKHQLAQMALEVEPARALVWYAAYALDADLADAARAVSLAKAHLCDVFTRAARGAIAAHGGIGYTWEYGLHFWLRRAIADHAWLGTPAQHRARAAALAGW